MVLTGTAGNKTVRIKFGGTTLLTDTIINTSTKSTIEGVLFNDGATNSQFEKNVTMNAAGDGTVVINTSTAAIDTTANADLVVTGQLVDGADTVAISLTYQP